MTPVDMETGPSTADEEWYAQEAANAAENGDTAERREEFAKTLHGKADEQTINARMLADISQGTHPSAARKNTSTSRNQQFRRTTR